MIKKGLWQQFVFAVGKGNGLFLNLAYQHVLQTETRSPVTLLYNALGLPYDGGDAPAAAQKLRISRATASCIINELMHVVTCRLCLRRRLLPALQTDTPPYSSVCMAASTLRRRQVVIIVQWCEQTRLINMLRIQSCSCSCNYDSRSFVDIFVTAKAGVYNIPTMLMLSVVKFWRILISSLELTSTWTKSNDCKFRVISLKPRLHQIHVAIYKYPGRPTCIRLHVSISVLLVLADISDDNFVADTRYM